MNIDYFPDKKKLWKNMFDNLKYYYDNPNQIKKYEKDQAEKLSKIFISGGNNTPYLIRILSKYIYFVYTLNTFKSNANKLDIKYIDKKIDNRLKNHINSIIFDTELILKSIFFHRKILDINIKQ